MYDHVLAPIAVRSCAIKNRVVRTAHGTNIGQGRVTDDLIAYHRARADGGVGLTVLEAASVHRSDTGTLRLHDESVIGDYQRLMLAIRPSGMRVFQQLGHLGYEAVTLDDGPPWAPSALAGPGVRRVAHAVSEAEIAELVEAFARAASWCRAGGLDGVEIHAGHGFLIQEFLSPATNLRDDGYGGDPTRRRRFLFEVLAAVRAAVGDLVVGLRIGPEATATGMDGDACADVVASLDAVGAFDYLSITLGGCHVPHKIIGAMHEPPGYELDPGAAIGAATRAPTIVTGRFRSLAEADEVIGSGRADMVGMTRAHIADPAVVHKTVTGRAAEVRPCIACNQGCVGGLNRGRLSCAVNADVGFEAVREALGAYARVEHTRRVLVIGGGPAGMETARVAALRGHAVTLVEASASLGGALRDARRLPSRALIGDIADWLAAEMSRLGVVVATSTVIDAASIDTWALESVADAVVVATGAHTPTRWLPGVPGAEAGAVPGVVDEAIGVAVLTSADVLAGRFPSPATDVLIVDAHGGYEAAGVAEHLLEAGHRVTYTSSDRRMAWRTLLDLTAVPQRERLTRLGLRLLTGHHLEALEPMGPLGPLGPLGPKGSRGAPDRTKVVLRSGADGARMSIDVDTVVLVSPQARGAAGDPVVDALRARRIEHHVVGDAHTPDGLWTAIGSANATGRLL